MDKGTQTPQSQMEDAQSIVPNLAEILETVRDISKNLTACTTDSQRERVLHLFSVYVVRILTELHIERQRSVAMEEIIHVIRELCPEMLENFLTRYALLATARLWEVQQHRPSPVERNREEVRRAALGDNLKP